MSDSYFMTQALLEAHKAYKRGEVPIGAVVVRDNVIVARAHNVRETLRDPSGHAEFKALLQTARTKDAWRLDDVTVYVTLEPCVMCAGLMHQARVKRCVFGAFDPKAGALGSLYEIHKDERLNHRFEVVSGVLEYECSLILRQFFRMRRAQNALKRQIGAQL